MSSWMVYCAEKSRKALLRAIGVIDEAATAIFAAAGDDLRDRVARGEPGEYGVVVGPASEGVSDINLAAAVANDGNARCVVLAQEGVSGSLRSRAARAGIDLVVDLSEIPEEPRARSEAGSLDGGPDMPAPLAPARGGVELPDISLRAPVLVVCSGRGGVGKTAVASVAACAAARWGMRVCLVDLDLSCGNARGCFGTPGKSDLASLASDGGLPEDDQLRRLCVSAAPGVCVMGPCDLPETAELATPYAGAALDFASREFDLVLVDTSTTFTDAVAQAAQMADRLVIVSDGKAGSISSVARMSGLAIRLGVARTKIARLENRADPREKTNYALGRAEVGLEAARVFRVFDGGQEVGDLLSSGQAHDLAEPGYPFADSVATFLAQLLQELGRLPEHDEARRAAEGMRSGRLRTLFGLRREAR